MLGAKFQRQRDKGSTETEGAVYGWVSTVSVTVATGLADCHSC